MTWSWKGLLKRALEFAGGSITSVAPIGRARIRYNEIKQQLEQSINGQAYAPLGLDIAASQQPDWYISPSTGSDDNDGATPGTALATHAELMRRLGSAPIDWEITVHITENLDEDLYIDLTFERDGYIHYVGTATTIASGSLTNVVDTNGAVNQPGEITDSGLPNDWGPLGLVGKRIRTTSGSNPGSISWIAKDLGSKQARVGEWTVVTYSTPMNYVLPNTVLAGDAYVVEDLPTVKSIYITVMQQYESSAFPVQPGHVVFDSLKVLGTNDVSTSLDNIWGGTWFLGCDINRLVSVTTKPGPVIQSSSVSESFNVGFLLSSVVMLTRYVFGDGDAALNTLFTDCVYVDVNPLFRAFFLQNCGFMDCADDGIAMYSGSSLRGYIWGSGNAGYGIDLAVGCFADLSGGTTITGALGDTRIGGVITPIAGLPFVNPANLAQIQV